jgi:S-adenosylmethionine hydrolase
VDIVLFTDFGSSDIYVGQVKSVLHRLAPQANVIDLANDLPPFNVRAAAHLLDALSKAFPKGSVFLCVVDPGVGTARDAVVLEADGRRYVGPDNGLISVVAARAAQIRLWTIAWRPGRLSNSFHGRDLFAPVVARIAADALSPDDLRPLPALGTSFGEEDLEEIIYIDHYGNACTGIRAAGAPRAAVLVANGHRITRARVFGDVPAGAALWHENSHGLVEIAVNRGSAAEALRLGIGLPVNWSG